jgi:tRNA C32,U32 (ribose-2'-O)-methylase TrmJ
MTMTAAPPIRFILFEPTHPGNIGSVARAMKTMGFHELVLVNPPDEWLCTDSRAMASGAQDVLLGVRVVPTLQQALEGCGLVLAASARHRRIGCPEMTPRECAAEVMDRAHLQPAACPSRNAPAWRTAGPLHHRLHRQPEYTSSIFVSRSSPRTAPAAGPGAECAPSRAGGRQNKTFYEHLERVLLGSGFLNPANPRHLMRRLRRLFNRTRLDENELNILRGILSSLVPGSGDNPRRD